MGNFVPTLPSTLKVKQYNNLACRVEQIRKGILIDFELLPPDPVSPGLYSLPFPFNCFGVKNSLAQSKDLIFHIKHTLAIWELFYNDTITKILLDRDEFISNPDVYIDLAELIAEKEGRVIIQGTGYDKDIKGSAWKKPATSSIVVNSNICTQDLVHILEYMANQRLPLVFMEGV